QRCHTKNCALFSMAALLVTLVTLAKRVVSKDTLCKQSILNQEFVRLKYFAYLCKKNNMKKNVFVLPTDKPSRLAFDIDDEFYILSEEPSSCFIVDKSCSALFQQDEVEVENRNIYITSDEEIKDNEWFLYEFGDSPEVVKCEIKLGNPNARKNCKKIILTTDPTLIADGVQEIDDEFLKVFVKNPSCEFFEVKHFGTCCGNQSITQCINCKKYNPVYKITIPQEEPKQETLEEAAERSAKLNRQDEAKWQKERLYSEEDMQEFARFSIECYRQGLPCVIAKDWFEQVKNKDTANG
ncbi:MAG: hypothetical protein EBU33_06970, partial [Sphingobacteriia bacterium]|nr:hypothetical protein [Sphingobacteriia bacterium]